MAPASPLQGCIIALSGNFPGRSQAVLESDLIIVLGATLTKSINEDTTHLVTLKTDFAKPSAKVNKAKSHGIPIVSLQWLEECLDTNSRLSEDDYSFEASDAAPAAVATTKGKATGSRKRSSKDDSEDDESQPQSKKTKSANTKGSQIHSQIQSQDASQSATSGSRSDSKISVKPKLERELTDGPSNVAKSSVVNIPIDETCPLAHYTIYIDNGGVIYDANLNQTNAGNNNNKFYRLQLLRNGNTDYKTWSRWGRVGERGQNATLGNGSLDDAIRHFEKKFKDKSGLAWANRSDAPKPNKYTFIERSYDDSDDEESGQAKVKTEEKSEAIDSKLAPEVQVLMALIFNQELFAAAMTDLNYDVNKLPLGKLSKNTIIRGYQALKDLSALLNDTSLADSQYGTTVQAAIEQVSNSFYSLIPHAFGRNRPPIIQSDEILKKEVELLDSLSDMKEAANILKGEPKDAEKVNALDRQFKGLNLDEMTPLNHSSTEFVELQNYLINTKGGTHGIKYHITQIFRVERIGEKERLEKSSFARTPGDRRLLWHGSRCTNFGGILSQGLRIAPPEAPVNGYMFGKGIYLADMSSKSANYCAHHTSNGQALLLLCEAELGDPMQILTDASHTANEDAKAKGLLSTWGQGLTGPSQWKDAKCVHPSLKGIRMPDTTVLPGDTNAQNAWLQYNEYIAYDVAQVRIRYLFQVRIEDGW
ncbi:Poly [ADP-ribose] polymerase 2-A [Hyphodiscus hymeniophilus]|uniref:Poly [ADP-ribose] polymerase n=1 Tax=Hyphodiscus hymeniophilus TaxID=353542 RepID=A0A9P7AUM0_9HELO|nr:Poly [ADP-ribose] polymerase 2-A [Hyphodiscus hymeniophilus]